MKAGHDARVVQSPAQDDPAPLTISKKTTPPRGGIAVWAVAAAVLSSFLFGYQTIVLNTCANLIAVELQWCDSDWRSDCSRSNFYIGLVNASVYLGAAFGAYFYGRPRVF